MWLSTILVLTHGLLLVHYVSAEPYLNLRWSRPVKPWFAGTPSTVGSERVLSSSNGLNGSRIETIRGNDDMGQASKSQKDIQTNKNRRLPSINGRTFHTTRSDTLNKFGKMPGSTPIDWNRLFLRLPKSEAPSNSPIPIGIPTVGGPLLTTVTPIQPLVSPTVPPYTPIVSPFTPTVSPYTYTPTESP
uniref:Uncharacterized protein n=1 Tax=Cacopsylla melanoneura TaxID=428564 RepID=A0A8D8XPC9_9HEMI